MFLTPSSSSVVIDSLPSGTVINMCVFCISDGNNLIGYDLLRIVSTELNDTHGKLLFDL